MLIKFVECCIAIAGIIISFQFGVFVGKNFGNFEKFLIELLNRLKREG